MYPVLIVEAKKKRITQIAIAEAIGVTRDTIRKKMERNGAFTIEEAMEIRKRFFPEMSLEELFKEKVQV